MSRLRSALRLRALFVPTAFAAALALGACTPGPACENPDAEGHCEDDHDHDAGEADPCEPGGHKHVEADGAAYCHCEPGYEAQEDPLACVEDDHDHDAGNDGHDGHDH